MRPGFPAWPWRAGVRLRIALLFGGLFLVAGAALLAITYGFVSRAANQVLVTGSQVGGSSSGGGLLPLTTLPSATQIRAFGEAQDAAVNDAQLMYSAIALGIMAVISVALGWFAAGRALRPLRRITTAARRIAATNLHERLALDGPDDDLRELAETIDGLFGRLDASFDAQRQFVANASHELRTPLARSRTLLEVALRDPDASAARLRTACERVLAAGEEQERLIEALLTLARGQRGIGSRRPLDLAALTRDALAARSAEITTRGLSMQVSLAPALLAGDSRLAERAVANLVDNALRHNIPGGSVWVTVTTQDDRATLTVANTGPVIPPGDVGRLLLPFQRRAETSRVRANAADGLGLGLSITSAIAAAHGAALSITARTEGGGLTAELAFPAVSPGAPCRSVPGRTPRTPLAAGSARTSAPVP